jgi:hypothetical protein
MNVGPLGRESCLRPGSEFQRPKELLMWLLTMRRTSGASLPQRGPKTKASHPRCHGNSYHIPAWIRTGMSVQSDVKSVLSREGNHLEDWTSWCSLRWLSSWFGQNRSLQTGVHTNHLVFNK